jgi:hypothetical protein
MPFETWPVKHLDVAMTVADPAFCSFNAASVTPDLRTPSMLAISSCVIFNSVR